VTLPSSYTSQYERSAWIPSRKSPLSLAQDFGRHHKGLDERLRIFDRHVVSDFISNTCEFLDDMHAAGVEEAPSSNQWYRRN